MKILFLMFSFPDMDKSFNMYTSLVCEFSMGGHEVFVVAPGQEKTGIKIEAGIKVLRVKTLPIKNVTNVIKGISNLILPFQYEIAINRFYQTDKVDLIVIPTPPITLVNLTSKLKKKLKSKVYLILRDIFPQNAVDMGFLSRYSLIYKYFRRLEKKLYDVSDYIGCMSQGNIEYVKAHNDFAYHKLHILRNFQKKYDLNIPVRAELKIKYNLNNKFVVIFGGNIGKPQQLENIIELANRCKKYEDVVFLILGEGNHKKNLELLINMNDVKNIQALDTIPKQDYQDLLRQCDLGLISLHEDFTIPNIPSKSLDYFNVGIPVLASIDKSTDYGKILDEAVAGLWSYAGHHDHFMRNFELLYRDSTIRKRMGRNGRLYYERFLTPNVVYNIMMEKIGNRIYE